MAETVQRILVVEDNDAFRSTVRDLLRDAGYKVRGARSVEKVSKRLSKQTFDLVLTDFELGDATGLDVIEVVNAQSPTTKLVLMTAAAELSGEAVRSGAARFLPKPFGMQALLALITEMLGTPPSPTTTPEPPQSNVPPTDSATTQEQSTNT